MDLKKSQLLTAGIAFDDSALPDCAYLDVLYCYY